MKIGWKINKNQQLFLFFKAATTSVLSFDGPHIYWDRCVGRDIYSSHTPPRRDLPCGSAVGGPPCPLPMDFTLHGKKFSTDASGPPDFKKPRTIKVALKAGLTNTLPFDLGGSAGNTVVATTNNGIRKGQSDRQTRDPSLATVRRAPQRRQFVCFDPWSLALRWASFRFFALHEGNSPFRGDD